MRYEVIRSEWAESVAKVLRVACPPVPGPLDWTPLTFVACVGVQGAPGRHACMIYAYVTSANALQIEHWRAVARATHDAIARER